MNINRLRCRGVTVHHQNYSSKKSCPQSAYGGVRQCVGSKARSRCCSYENMEDY
jgi:hypothetical protein